MPFGLCKVPNTFQKVDMTRRYVSRYGVHWIIEGRWSCGVAFCGNTNNVGHKGGKHC
jgi:hypothetical protein